jgi:hypothetical protein
LAVQSSSASATSATGFIVGWAASASMRTRVNVFTPGYVQTLDRLRPNRPLDIVSVRSGADAENAD